MSHLLRNYCMYVDKILCAYFRKCKTVLEPRVLAYLEYYPQNLTNVKLGEVTSFYLTVKRFLIKRV